MAENDVRLLGTWTSPYVMRARIALKIKSVNYQFIRENFVPKSELLLKSNPVHKKIPVFFHSDKIICESLIIVQYIDEFWSTGPNILPSDPYDRAVARFWAAYVDDKWFPTVGGMVARQIGEEAKQEVVKQLHEGLVLLEDAFKKCSNGNKFFGGDKIGYLDMALGSCLAWMRVVEKLNNVKILDVAITPDLYKWSQDFCADDAVKDFMPETDKLLEFAKDVIIPWLKASPPN